MRIKKFISTFFCAGFGVGFSPYFPGTLASFTILPVCWFLKENFSTQFFVLTVCVYILICFFLLKIILIDKNNMDPKYVVCDEHIGQAIAIIFCNQKVLEYFIAFLLFRILDIFKPYPISYFDNLKNVSGVILDDVLAGLIVSLVFLIYHGM